jgi:hypothetical protein
VRCSIYFVPVPVSLFCFDFSQVLMSFPPLLLIWIGLHRDSTKWMLHPDAAQRGRNSRWELVAAGYSSVCHLVCN